MNKNKIKKIVGYIFVFVVLFAISGNVKGTSYCSYYSSSGISKYENVGVKVTFTGSEPNATIESYANKTMNNGEKIQNWSDISSTYSSTGECPSYVMVTKTVTGYNVYLSYDQESLQKIADSKKISIGSENAIMTTSTDYNKKQSNTNNNYYKNVEDKTAAISDAANNFDMKSCIDNSKTITRIRECRIKYENSLNLLNSAESEIRSLIKSGYISEDDQRVKSFFDAIESAKKKWDSVEKQIEAEQKKIDDEMGLTDPNETETTKSSSWNSNDGNTNKFLKKIWNMLKIIIPMLVIIFSIADFLKVLFISDEKNYKEAYTRLLTRIGVGIILFVLPAILSLLLNLAGLQDIGIFEIFS